jgi:hypothetical protein
MKEQNNEKDCHRKNNRNLLHRLLFHSTEIVGGLGVRKQISNRHANMNWIIEAYLIQQVSLECNQ